ncbi:MAG: hypothetical protein NTY23_04855 [Chloroflexi bacterium]|nr:hypothetical protein [Chloroflexota bacterium]
MKKQWLPYIPVVLYVVAWAWIFYASAQAGCDDNVGIAQTQGGLCTARKIAGLSCFAVYFAVWTYLGGLVAKGKGRNPLIGWILGFILQFMGCLFMLMWEPRRDNLGRMIGWDEYKHMSVEERKAIRPRPAPVSPGFKRTRLIAVVIVILVTVLVLALQVLRNLGKL